MSSWDSDGPDRDWRDWLKIIVWTLLCIVVFGGALLALNYYVFE